jgi:hypothetical protein
MPSTLTLFTDDEIEVHSLSSQSGRTASTTLTLECQEAMGAFQRPGLRKLVLYLRQCRDACHGSLPQDNLHGVTEERVSCSVNDSESSVKGTLLEHQA